MLLFWAMLLFDWGNIYIIKPNFAAGVLRASDAGNYQRFDCAGRNFEKCFNLFPVLRSRNRMQCFRCCAAQHFVFGVPAFHFNKRRTFYSFCFYPAAQFVNSRFQTVNSTHPIVNGVGRRMGLGD